MKFLVVLAAIAAVCSAEGDAEPRADSDASITSPLALPYIYGQYNAYGSLPYAYSAYPYTAYNANPYANYYHPYALNYGYNLWGYNNPITYTAIPAAPVAAATVEVKSEPAVVAPVEAVVPADTTPVVEAAPVQISPINYGVPAYHLSSMYAPSYYATPAVVSAPAAPAVVTPAVATKAVAAPVVTAVPAGVVSTQYHAQDEFGNLQYGYSNINSAKTEVGNTYTGVQGSYQYVDANGILQTVNYIADDLGFRVADSRLPVDTNTAPVGPVYTGVAPTPVVDTPEVAAAKAEFKKAFDEIAVAHSIEKRAALSDPQVVYGYNALPFTYGAGYYTPLLSYHSHAYPYVAGYGPRAFSYHYRS